MSDTTSIKAAAEAYIKSYGEAMHLAQSDPPTPTPDVATALSSHYLPGLISFVFGTITAFPDNKFATFVIEDHLERFTKAAVGYDIRQKKSRIELINDVGGSALCFITWEMYPAKGWTGGDKGWEWENCYFYRRRKDGSEGWEGIISDAEIEGIAKHVPDAMPEMLPGLTG